MEGVLRLPSSSPACALLDLHVLGGGDCSETRVRFGGWEPPSDAQVCQEWNFL